SRSEHSSRSPRVWSSSPACPGMRRRSSRIALLRLLSFVSICSHFTLRSWAGCGASLWFSLRRWQSAPIPHIWGSPPGSFSVWGPGRQVRALHRFVGTERESGYVVRESVMRHALSNLIVAGRDALEEFETFSTGDQIEQQ